MKFFHNFPTFSKFILVLLIGLLSFLIPLWSIKIILFIVGLFIFSTILKKGKIVFFILVFIFSIPFISIKRFSDNFFEFYNFFGNFEISSNEKYIIQPDKKQFPIYSDITIDIKNQNGVIIELVDGDSIEFPSKLNLITDNKKIEINNYGYFTKNYYFVIKIGTKGVKNLKISATKIEISGKVKLDNLILNGTAINMKNCSIESEYLNVSGTAINLSDFFRGNYAYIDGTALNFSGTFDFQQIKIDGTSINLNLNIGKLNKETVIDGTAINATINFLSDNPKILNIDGTSGVVKVKNYESATINIDGPKIILEK
ncbi:hypothetical protein [Thermosipho globiformans]|uniref:hypothetical protein n=1 Tax=Thermosipho globiformans TaxID=380685 RepID=UPI000F8C8CF3|nr:hypothetical protein [Thermosipho globiformans]